MSRPFLTFLLIANLLACPLRCLPAACEAGTVEVEQQAAPACCCSHGEKVPLSDTPACPGEDDCQCQNCICEGATLPEVREMPDFVVSAIGSDDVIASNVSRCLDRPLTRVRHRYDRGRDVRIAHQSWLN